MQVPSQLLKTESKSCFPGAALPHTRHKSPSHACSHSHMQARTDVQGPPNLLTPWKCACLPKPLGGHHHIEPTPCFANHADFLKSWPTASHEMHLSLAPEHTVPSRNHSAAEPIRQRSGREACWKHTNSRQSVVQGFGAVGGTVIMMVPGCRPAAICLSYSVAQQVVLY